MKSNNAQQISPKTLKVKWNPHQIPTHTTTHLSTMRTPHLNTGLTLTIAPLVSSPQLQQLIILTKAYNFNPVCLLKHRMIFALKITLLSTSKRNQATFLNFNQDNIRRTLSQTFGPIIIEQINR